MSGNPVRHYSIKVSGKVQGVFFRQSAAEEAARTGIAGFVRNEPDGSVYMEAEGTQHQLDLLVAWCRTGPPRAQVTRVDFSEGHVKGYSGFLIAT